MPIRIRALSLCLFLVSCCAGLHAQRPANAIYQQLRSLTTDSEVITVNNLVLRRDAAIFTFRHGIPAFYSEINGKVTGGGRLVKHAWYY